MTDPNGTEPSDETVPGLKIRHDRLRDLVWRTFVQFGEKDKDFERAVNSMGVFNFFHVVDAVVDAVVDEQNRLEPMNLRLDLAEAEIIQLRKWLDEARELIGAAS